MRDDDLISASEISEFLYCHRSWWYRLHSVPSANQPVMDQGARVHDRLGQQVGQAEQSRKRGRQLVWLALGLLLLFVLFKLLSG